MADGIVRVHANESTPSQRRIWFDLRDATDGISVETGEAGGQPQISTNGAAWTNTGIGVLVAVGQSLYYADLDQNTVATAGNYIKTRFKSANTAETPGTFVVVTSGDPIEDVVSATAAAVIAELSSAPGLIVVPTATISMTLGEAVTFARSCLRDTDAASYTADDIRNAVRVVTDELLDIAPLNTVIQTFTSPSSGNELDLSTLSSFRSERMQRVQIGFRDVEHVSYDTISKDLDVDTSTGQPEKIAFPTATQGFVYRALDASYDFKFIYTVPIGQLVADTDVIQVPIEYMRQAIRWGVTQFLYEAEKMPGLAANNRLEFLRFSNRLRARSFPDRGSVVIPTERYL